MQIRIKPGGDLMSEAFSGYHRIEDYALIGDCRCAALVSRFGSIDWLCLPRFDSPSVFAAILDYRKGGHFSICPAEKYNSRQSYIDKTNVLETVFSSDSGVLRLIDLMPISTREEIKRTLLPQREVLRSVQCLEGEVEIVVDTNLDSITAGSSRDSNRGDI
jgi:GH15 family glucan-1,4-alpha-glucosidase